MLKAISMQRAYFYASLSRLRYRGIPSAIWLAGRCVSANCRTSYPPLRRGFRVRSRRSSDRGQATCGWCSSLVCSAQFRWWPGQSALWSR